MSKKQGRQYQQENIRESNIAVTAMVTVPKVALPVSHTVADLLANSVADPGCLSWIPDQNFSHPGSWAQSQKHPRFGSASKNLSILTQKIVSKLSKIWSGLFIPDPDPDFFFFLPIPDPGVKKASNPGFGSATLLANYRVPIAIGKNTVAPANMRIATEMTPSIADMPANVGRDASKSRNATQVHWQQQRRQQEQRQQEHQGHHHRVEMQANSQNA
jgi:hypothetical protein